MCVCVCVCVCGRMNLGSHFGTWNAGSSTPSSAHTPPHRTPPHHTPPHHTTPHQTPPHTDVHRHGHRPCCHPFLLVKPRTAHVGEGRRPAWKMLLDGWSLRNLELRTWNLGLGAVRVVDAGGCGGGGSSGARIILGYASSVPSTGPHGRPPTSPSIKEEPRAACLFLPRPPLGPIACHLLAAPLT